MKLIKLGSMSSALLFVCSLVFGSVCGITALAFISAPKQGTTKVFEKRKQIAPEVVSVLEIESSDKRLMIGESFHAGEDWLKGTKFKLRNDSGREIVYVAFELEFPETTAIGDVMIFPIQIGRRPGSIIANKKQPLILKADQELTIELDEGTYTALRRFIESRLPLANISKVIVNVQFVAFDDDTGWSNGEYMRQTPDNPNRWVPIVKSPLK